MSPLEHHADTQTVDSNPAAEVSNPQIHTKPPTKPPISLHGLMAALNLHELPDYASVPNDQIQLACSELQAAQLNDILTKYIGTEDMFTQQYLHGVEENIKLLVHIGKAVETPDAAADMYEHLKEREPLFVRALVAVFKAWYEKTARAPSDTPPKTEERVEVTIEP